MRPTRRLDTKSPLPTGEEKDSDDSEIIVRRIFANCIDAALYGAFAYIASWIVIPILGYPLLEVSPPGPVVWAIIFGGWVCLAVLTETLMLGSSFGKCAAGITVVRSGPGLEFNVNICQTFVRSLVKTSTYGLFIGGPLLLNWLYWEAGESKDAPPMFPLLISLYVVIVLATIVVSLGGHRKDRRAFHDLVAKTVIERR